MRRFLSAPAPSARTPGEPNDLALRGLFAVAGRHSLRRAEDGWVWKFDSEAMGSRRFGEPVREYLQAAGCRAALIFW